MKKFGKSILVAAVAVVAICHFTVPTAVRAEVITANDLDGPIVLKQGNGVSTTGVAAATSQTFSNQIDVITLVNGDTDLGIDFRGVLQYPGTLVVTARFARANSTNAPETTAGVKLFFTPTGATTNQAWTNLNLSASSVGRGCPFLVYQGIDNPNTSAVTAVRIRYVRIPRNRLAPTPP